VTSRRRAAVAYARPCLQSAKPDFHWHTPILHARGAGVAGESKGPAGSALLRRKAREAAVAAAMQALEKLDAQNRWDSDPRNRIIA
jgi:hypothetical protein